MAMNLRCVQSSDSLGRKNVSYLWTRSGVSVAGVSAPAPHLTIGLSAATCVAIQRELYESVSAKHLLRRLHGDVGAIAIAQLTAIGFSPTPRRTVTLQTTTVVVATSEDSVEDMSGLSWHYSGR